MDISLKIGDYLLNYRVSALIRNGNKILVHHNIEKNHYTLPGGRVKSGESSIVALQREIREEMGQETQYIRPVSLIENFFYMKNNRYHELLFTHELKFTDKNMYKLEKINSMEEEKKGKLEFLWINIDDVNENNFLPKKIVKVIKENNNKFEHYINDEINK